MFIICIMAGMKRTLLANKHIIRPGGTFLSRTSRPRVAVRFKPQADSIFYENKNTI